MIPVVRAATTADLPFLVWVMREASTSHLERSVWSTLLHLPDDDVSALLGAIATGPQPHWCHLDRFRVVEVDGAPVAAASSFDPQTEGNDALFAAAHDVLARSGADGAAIEAALTRAALVDGVTPKPYPNAWAIENVAVAPDHRGMGLSGLLLEAAIDDARSHGREHAQILCLDGNHRAQRAWERSGFSVRAEYRGRDFDALVGARGMKLLVRELG